MSFKCSEVIRCGKDTDGKDLPSPYEAVLFVCGDSHKCMCSEAFVPAWAVKTAAKEKEPALVLSTVPLKLDPPSSWKDFLKAPSVPPQPQPESEAANPAEAEAPNMKLQVDVPVFQFGDQIRGKVKPDAPNSSLGEYSVL